MAKSVENRPLAVAYPPPPIILILRDITPIKNYKLISKKPKRTLFLFEKIFAFIKGIKFLSFLKFQTFYYQKYVLFLRYIRITGYVHWNQTTGSVIPSPPPVIFLTDTIERGANAVGMRIPPPATIESGDWERSSRLQPYKPLFCMGGGV